MPQPSRYVAPQMLVALNLTQSFRDFNCQKLQSEPRTESRDEAGAIACAPFLFSPAISDSADKSFPEIPFNGTGP